MSNGGALAPLGMITGRRVTPPEVRRMSEGSLAPLGMITGQAWACREVHLCR
jgi:hypothetical protein